MQIPAPSRQRVPRLPFAGGDGAISRILIVEDDIHHGTTTQDYLRAKGYEVVWVTRGDRALEEFRKQEFDLALVDVMVPGIDGYEVCQTIKSECGDNFIPVLFVTARGAIADKIAGFDSHADGYVTKPYDLRLLLSEIRALIRAKRHHDLLAKEKCNFERLSSLDPLTGLSNRRVFMERLAYEIARAGRYDGDLSVVLLDIDHFKKINDGYGHMVGDDVLAQLANLLRAQLREVDILARFGGEEFICLLPNTDATATRFIAERLCKRIGEHAFISSNAFDASLRPVANDTTIESVRPAPEVVLPVTVSIGTTTASGRVVQAGQLVNEADQAMYAAKNAGRNRVFAAASILSEPPGQRRHPAKPSAAL